MSLKVGNFSLNNHSSNTINTKLEKVSPNHHPQIDRFLNHVVGMTNGGGNSKGGSSMGGLSAEEAKMLQVFSSSVDAIEMYVFRMMLAPSKVNGYIPSIG